MGFMGFDFTYLLFMVPALIISIYAQYKVKATFNKYSSIAVRRTMTGADAAQLVLSQGGADGVSIRQIAGNLTDNFDPSNNLISLSQNVFANTSISAIGVAAHEAGHAVQYAKSYLPIRIRTFMVPAVKITSMLSTPLIIIGFLLPTQFRFVVILGIIFFSAAVLFSIVTLPVEFNASNRAIRILDESGSLTEEELAGAKKVLQAAAMTYVASTLTAVLSLLRLLMMSGRRNR